MNRYSYLFILVCSILLSCQPENKKAPSTTNSIETAENAVTQETPKAGESPYTGAVGSTQQDKEERNRAMENETENGTRGNSANPIASYTNPDDLPIAGTYKYSHGNQGNGSLVISKGPANAYNFIYETEGDEPDKKQGSMEGFFVLVGNKARFGTKGKNGKCEVQFVFEGDKVTTRLLNGEAGDCGSFGNGVSPNAKFTKVK